MSGFHHCGLCVIAMWEVDESPESSRCNNHSKTPPTSEEVTRSEICVATCGTRVIATHKQHLHQQGWKFVSQSQNFWRWCWCDMSRLFTQVFAIKTLKTSLNFAVNLPKPLKFVITSWKYCVTHEVQVMVLFERLRHSWRITQAICPHFRDHFRAPVVWCAESWFFV